MNKAIKKPFYPSTGSRIAVLVMILFMAAMIVAPLSAEEIFKGAVTADGEVLVFGGRVLDQLGRPVQNTSVEIWQTDGRGVYQHPGDSKTNQRDKGFQFFGTSVTDSSGNYMFRTIVPGQYEPRPRHIHVKIRRSGKVILTSQIYFSVDGETSGVGSSTRNLRMELDAVENPDGSTLYNGIFDFVVDTGITGDLPLTDRQGEGPYYPRDDVSKYDNDLAQVAAD